MFRAILAAIHGTPEMTNSDITVIIENVDLYTHFYSYYMVFTAPKDVTLDANQWKV
jgi:hypothetical protein